MISLRGYLNLENRKEKGDVFERFIKLYSTNGWRYRLLFKEVRQFNLDFKIELLDELEDLRKFALYLDLIHRHVAFIDKIKTNEESIFK